MGKFTTWNENKNTENTSLFTDTQGSNSNYYSANLIQPIFRVDTWFQFSQGKALGEAAEANSPFHNKKPSSEYPTFISIF